MMIRHAVLAAAMGMCIAITALSGGVASLTPQASAQSATPVAGVNVDPGNCMTEPISTDDASALLATPVASPELPMTGNGIVALPAGDPADAQTATDVEAVVSQLWSCNNARDKARVLGLFTDQAIQESFGSAEGSTWDLAALRADVAAALTPGDPRSEDEWATVDDLVSVTVLENGQIGVLILNSDPFVLDGDQVLDYFQFEQSEGTYLVSSFVLDPFDLTPEYGFEKNA